VTRLRSSKPAPVDTAGVPASAMKRWLRGPLASLDTNNDDAIQAEEMSRADRLREADTDGDRTPEADVLAWSQIPADAFHQPKR
jgi:hypothetical protein